MDALTPARHLHLPQAAMLALDGRQNRGKGGFGNGAGAIIL